MESFPRELRRNSRSEMVDEENFERLVIREDDQVSQIIRDSLEVTEAGPRVERVESANGRSRRQARDEATVGGSESADLATSGDGSRKSSRTGLTKRSGKAKFTKCLRRQESRSKLAEKLSREFELHHFDMPEVHSSLAITNLLAQLYPNPYNLISFLDVDNKLNPIDRISSSGIKLEAKPSLHNAVCRISGSCDKTNLSLELTATEVTEPPVNDKKSLMETGVIAITIQDKSQTKLEEPPPDDNNTKVEVENTELPLVESVVRGAVESNDNKTSIEIITERENVMEGKIESPKSEPITRPESGSKKRAKTVKTESKVVKSRVQKKPIEKAEAKPMSAKEKGTISGIHPLSPSRKNRADHEDDEVEMKSLQIKTHKTGKQSSSKKKVVQYLELIKEMYEAEERCLQSTINNAWYFALDQMQKAVKPPSRGTKTHQFPAQKTATTKERKFKNSHSQTPKLKRVNVGKRKSNTEFRGKAISNPILTQPEVLQTDNRTQPVSEETAKSGSPTKRELNEELFANVESNVSGSEVTAWQQNKQKNWEVAVFRPPSTDLQPATNKQSRIRTDTYVFRQKISKNGEPDREETPFDDININVIETNRKIDLLIQHLDNSINWLSQSEKNEAVNRTAMIEKVEELPDNVKDNAKQQEAVSDNENDSLRLYENKNMSKNKSDLLISSSYQELQFLDSRIGNLRIRTGSFYKNPIHDSVWKMPHGIRPSSTSNMMIPYSRSANYLTSNKMMQNFVIPGEKFFQRRKTESDVPKGTRTENEPTMIFMGKSDEDVRDRGKLNRAISEGTRNWVDIPGVYGRSSINVCGMNSWESMSSFSLGFFAEGSASAHKPVVMQEVTWGFPIPAPSPVSRKHCRNERHMVYTTAEATVLHVANQIYFLNLSLMNLPKVVERQPEQQPITAIISIHKSSGFAKHNDSVEEADKARDFTNFIPDDKSSGNIISDEDANGLRPKHEIDKDRGIRTWDRIRSESSVDFHNVSKVGINKMRSYMRRFRYGDDMSWLTPLSDPYESNPADEDGELMGMKQTNFSAMRSDPVQQNNLSAPNDWDQRRMNFGTSAAPIFRYLSSETSNSSMIQNNRNPLLKSKKKNDRIRNTLSSALISDVKKPTENVEKGSNRKQEDDNSSTTSSFKSSNDLSDLSELTEPNYSKKKGKSRSHFLEKLFHEIRSFRKCLTRQRGSKRKNQQDDHNEFQDALSEVEFQQERKVDEPDRKHMRQDAVAVNSICIDEVGSHERKIFKTSFRGKESVTELMIDLKDVSISDISDISVEKRKLSTDHTKISITISKQPAEICCTNQSYGKVEAGPTEQDSYHSLEDLTRPQKFLVWKKEDSKSEDEDDDYHSADSCPHSKSMENITDKRRQESDYRSKLVMESRRRDKSFGRHKFDFYKKMDDPSTPDSLRVEGNNLLFRYEKEIAPLKKTLADMQFRIKNVQKKTLCSSDEYYERALRMAKMSAGYCQSCKNKTVIPEDPLGVYKKLIPRTNIANPYGKQKKYYFRTTSSTNSSFYSIRSSNSDVSDNFCLNSSSSIITNGLSRSPGPLLRESSKSGVPLFVGRTIQL